MARKQVEVTIVEARELKRVAFFGSNQPVAVAWVNPRAARSTHVAVNGGSNPKWNHRLLVPVNDDLSPSIHWVLKIQVSHHLGFLCCLHRPIGTAFIPVADILNAAPSFPLDIDQDSQPLPVLTYPLLGAFKRPNGFLDVTIRFHKVPPGFHPPLSSPSPSSSPPIPISPPQSSSQPPSSSTPSSTYYSSRQSLHEEDLPPLSPTHTPLSTSSSSGMHSLEKDELPLHSGSSPTSPPPLSIATPPPPLPPSNYFPTLAPPLKPLPSSSVEVSKPTITTPFQIRPIPPPPPPPLTHKASLPRRVPLLAPIPAPIPTRPTFLAPTQKASLPTPTPIAPTSKFSTIPVETTPSVTTTPLSLPPIPIPPFVESIDAALSTPTSIHPIEGAPLPTPKPTLDAPTTSGPSTTKFPISKPTTFTTLPSYPIPTAPLSISTPMERTNPIKGAPLPTPNSTSHAPATTTGPSTTKFPISKPTTFTTLSSYPIPTAPLSIPTPMERTDPIKGAPLPTPKSSPDAPATTRPSTTKLPISKPTRFTTLPSYPIPTAPLSIPTPMERTDPIKGAPLPTPNSTSDAPTTIGPSTTKFPISKPTTFTTIPAFPIPTAPLSISTPMERANPNPMPKHSTPLSTLPIPIPRATMLETPTPDRTFATPITLPFTPLSSLPFPTPPARMPPPPTTPFPTLEATLIHITSTTLVSDPNPSPLASSPSVHSEKKDSLPDTMPSSIIESIKDGKHGINGSCDKVEGSSSSTMPKSRDDNNIETSDGKMHVPLPISKFKDDEKHSMWDESEQVEEGLYDQPFVGDHDYHDSLTLSPYDHPSFDLEQLYPQLKYPEPQYIDPTHQLYPHKEEMEVSYYYPSTIHEILKD